MVYLALLPVPLLLATSFLASIASATALPQQAQPKIDPNLVCEGELIAIEIQGETTPDTPSNCLDSAGHLADSGTKVACGNFKVTRKDDGDLVVAETSRAGGGKNYCKLVSNIITCGETSEPQVSHL
ncbi:MAG: hypothetical protein M1829_005441, partial [Trizodia sp. TS-e1964]